MLDVALAVAWRALSWILGLLDTVYLYLAVRGRTCHFFEDGYGNLEDELRFQTFVRENVAPKMLSNPNQLPIPAVAVINELKQTGQQAELEMQASKFAIDCRTAHFTSPAAEFLPPESQQCRFFVVKPPKGVPINAVCVMLPATADEGETVRRNLYADTLAAQGVLGLIVEAPFYGSRRPGNQQKWFLRQLHHSFVQVYTVALESACLLHWASHTWGVPLAVTGVSAGAAMAGLTAKFFNGPLAAVPYMGCAGPAEPFTAGVMQSVVCWDAMQEPPCDPSFFGNPADTAHLPRDRAAFLAYCRFFTNSSILRESLPAHGTGQQVLHILQARDDNFVSFTDGKALFSELLYLAEGTQEVHLERSDSGDSSESGAIQAVYGAMKRAFNSYTDLLSSSGPMTKKKARSSSRSGQAAFDGVQQKQTSKTQVSTDAKSAEFVQIIGGHCTGFLMANHLLPNAVMSSLDRLRKKIASA